ncbi:MAG: hypothetical protein GY861_22260 [bacterium]|nr:hypothetical protein [bacterium]
MDEVITELIMRSEEHDKSKLSDPELSTFVKYTPMLAITTYGSDKYKQCLEGMKSALEHHYSNNRHHPEHFQEEADATFRESPVNCMNLIDIIEMLCDWKAASMRHSDGDIQESIEINKKRFGISNQLSSVLRNTTDLLGWE